MDTKKHKKTPFKFECLICDFKCSRNAEYLRHIITVKHATLTKGYSEDTQKHKKNTDENFCCENCGKHYKFHSGLWRHKKTCIKIDVKKEDPTDKELIMMLLKQNTQLIEQNAELVKNGTHHTTNNKTFNLNFFLNETCKDAMNIMDFVDTIKVQLTDLIKVGEIGYVEGISNIITNNLKALDISQRPIHCTDKKREVLYIKDEDKWEKDEEKKKLRKAIKTVAYKNINALPQFKEKYPDCKESDSKFSDQYNHLIIEAMGGPGDNNMEKEDNIIKNISKLVIVDKD